METYNNHGAYFAPPLMMVNAGGTHEANPRDGVRLGADGRGIPNLVEQGETIYDDYVFSDRLRPSGADLRNFVIPERYSGKTFAQISKALGKEIEQRPNDVLSNASLGVMLDRLTACQEDFKRRKEEARARRELGKMSPEELMSLGAQLSRLRQAQRQGQPLTPPPQGMSPEERMMSGRGGMSPEEQAMMQQQMAGQAPEEQMYAEQAGQMSMMQGAPMMACGGLLRRYDEGGDIPPQAPLLLSPDGKSAYAMEYLLTHPEVAVNADGMPAHSEPPVSYGGVLDGAKVTADSPETRAFIDKVNEGRDRFVRDAVSVADAATFGMVPPITAVADLLRGNPGKAGMNMALTAMPLVSRTMRIANKAAGKAGKLLKDVADKEDEVMTARGMLMAARKSDGAGKAADVKAASEMLRSSEKELKAAVKAARKEGAYSPNRGLLNKLLYPFVPGLRYARRTPAGRVLQGAVSTGTLTGAASGIPYFYDTYGDGYYDGFGGEGEQPEILLYGHPDTLAHPSYSNAGKAVETVNRYDGGGKAAVLPTAVVTEDYKPMPQFSDPWLSRPTGVDSFLRNWGSRKASDMIDREIDGILGSTDVPVAAGGKDGRTWLPTGLRYAGAVQSGLGALASVLQKPDRTLPDSYNRMAANLPMPQVSYNPQFVRTRYNPIDTGIATARLLANANAARRSVMNSGAGPASAGLIQAMNHSANLGLGQTAYAQRMANEDMYDKNAQYINQVEQQNAAGLMSARQQNASLAMQRAQMADYLRQLALRAYDEENSARAAAISANLTNLANNLAGIGRENFAMNQVNSNRRNLGYGIGSDGVVSYDKGSGGDRQQG